MMEPLEAGERVLNGVRNNDLFIFSHPEFKDGMQERFDAFLASVPDETPPPGACQGRADPGPLPDLSAGDRAPQGQAQVVSELRNP